MRSCSRGRHWSHFPETSLQSLLTGRVWFFSPDGDDVLHQKKTLCSAGRTKTFPDVSHLLSLMMYVTTVHWGHTSGEPGSQTEVLILTGQYFIQNSKVKIKCWWYLFFKSRVFDPTFKVFLFLFASIIWLYKKTKQNTDPEIGPSYQIDFRLEKLKWNILCCFQIKGTSTFKSSGY